MDIVAIFKNYSKNISELERQQKCKINDKNLIEELEMLQLHESFLFLSCSSQNRKCQEVRGQLATYQF